MRTSIIPFAAGLLLMGLANHVDAQAVEIVEVRWTFAPDCVPGEDSGVDILVNATGSSPGDIIISGQVLGCTPELGPFINSSVNCDNRPEMVGVAMAEHRDDPDDMDSIEFSMLACQSGSQSNNGTGGTAGAGGDGTDSNEGCSCTIQSSKLQHAGLGVGILIVATLAFRRIRRRRRG